MPCQEDFSATDPWLPHLLGGEVNWGSKRQCGFPDSPGALLMAVWPLTLSHPMFGFHQPNDKGLCVGPVIAGVLYTIIVIP